MQSLTKVLNTYAKQVQEIASSAGRELSYRTAFENLLKELLKGNDIKVLHEGNVQSFVGQESRKTPDFLLYKKENGNNVLTGSIEAKDLHVDLNKTVKSEQAKNYAQLNENLLITNYKELVLTEFIDGKVQVKQKVNILNDSLKPLVNDENLSNLQALLHNFCNYEYKAITSRDKLAKTLAVQTSILKNNVLNYFNVEENKITAFCTKLTALKEEYNKVISIEQSLVEFIEVYAQSFIYGLVIGKITYEQKNNQPFLLKEDDIRFIDDVSEEFEKDYSILYEFLNQGLDTRKIPNDLKPTFLQIAKVFNTISFIDILKSAKIDFNHLITYLYEDYLAQYDNLERKAKGVYYTAPEVVNYIIRASDQALENNLNIQGGFSHQSVKVLDFATGTGSFLNELLNHELTQANTQVKKDALAQKATNDYYGFELLFAPYLIAHTNLLYNLKQQGVNLKQGASLPIYLTNSLDLQQDSISNLLPYLAQNYQKSQNIKLSENIMVLIGNPPYNSSSSNKGEGILNLLQSYKQGLNETTYNSLSDDYIKFIRLAQHKVKQAGNGIVGIITNNSFISGVTHRQMRKSLMATFDEIYILNLHGNSLIKEVGKDGKQDQNVFDIRVGTNISIFVKHQTPLKECKVYYYSTLANGLSTRQAKLQFLAQNDLKTTPWQELKPQESDYCFFIPKDFETQKEYDGFYSLVKRDQTSDDNAVFTHYGTGIETGRDNFTIHYTKQSLEVLRTDIKDLKEHEIEQKYSVGKDSLEWQLNLAKEDLVNNYNPQAVLYKPFDIRYTSLSRSAKKFIRRPNYDIAQHFESGKSNLAIGVKRQIEGNFFNSISISDISIERQIHAGPGPVSLVPLYTYTPLDEQGNKIGKSKKQGGLFNAQDEQQEKPLNEYFASKKLQIKGQYYLKETNFTKEFLNFLQSNKNFSTTFKQQLKPESIISYIYAVMHQTSYRTKYLEFLKIDFPKVPFTNVSEDEFKALANIGSKLVKLHTLEEIAQNNIDYKITDSNNQKIDLNQALQDFIINKINFTENKADENNSTLQLIAQDGTKIELSSISKEAWLYKIGSYQVLDKWLKYRKKDQYKLQQSDITHLINTIANIEETIKLQRLLDEKR